MSVTDIVGPRSGKSVARRLGSLVQLARRLTQNPETAELAYSDPQWTAFAYSNRALLETAFQLCGPADDRMADSGRLGCYIAEMGWVETYKTKRSVNTDGHAIPWFAYPAIEFLSKRVPTDVAVFEYGAGLSTLWWNERVRSVITCEHDQDWIAQIAAALPAAKLLHRPLDGDGAYQREITNYRAQFDIVVVDGRQRVACILNSLAALTDRGVIILDNSDRHAYQPGKDFLISGGFRELEFSGLGPIVAYATSTSIFYRDSNCLVI
jgi:hypothetical protein